MCHRGGFSEDIIEKFVFYKTEDNGIEHVNNNCIISKKVREKFIDKLNKLDAIQKIKRYKKLLNIFIIVRNYLILKMKIRMIIMEKN